MAQPDSRSYENYSNIPVRAKSVAAENINPAHAESVKEHETRFDRAPRVVRPEHSETSVTLILEQQAAKIPSHYFLTFSIGAMGLAAYFEFINRPREGRFVSMWAPTLLIMGVYNKLVKSLGSR